MSEPALLPEVADAVLSIPAVSEENADPLSTLVSQFGIASIRAAVLDRVSLDTRASWSTSLPRDMPAVAIETSSDGVFIAAREASESLNDAPADHTVVRKLSPRLWSFAWTAGPHHLVIVEVRYRDRRDALDGTETSLARLLFLQLSRTGSRDNDEQAAAAAALTWPAVERRRGRDWRSQLRAQALPLSLLGLSALLASWLAVVSLPAAMQEQAAQRAETARLQTMTDRTVVDHVSKALTTGDFGDLQDELSGFHALGYFEKAVVLNARQRVVASVGMGNEALIGGAAPSTLAAARSVPLIQSGDELGRLLHPEPPRPRDSVALASLRALAVAGALAAAAAALSLLWPLLKRRR